MLVIVRHTDTSSYRAVKRMSTQRGRLWDGRMLTTGRVGALQTKSAQGHIAKEERAQSLTSRLTKNLMRLL